MLLDIPPGVAWSIFIALCTAVAGAYILLLRTSWKVDGKVNEKECTERHAEMKGELVGIGKDIEYLVRKHDGEPAPRPSNGGH